MPIPQNAQAIWNFLLSHGFVPNAAAGILGNIEQESGGNPATPGGGLIQILRGNPGYTSDPSLPAQMQSIINYINANGSVADVNAHATTPQDAALYFSTKYERPNPAQANNANRQQSAADVLAASKSGNWNTTTSNQPPSANAAGGGGLFSWPGDIIGFFKDAKAFVDALMWIVNPASWLRIGSFMAGIVLALMAAWILIKVGSDDPLIKLPSTIPVPV